MKIIRGVLKNREISCPPLARPVSAIFREAYFQIIEPYDVKNFCDLFCGSGIMGIEFLSRYPESKVHFVDTSKDALRLLEKTLLKFNVDARAELIQADAYSFARQLPDVNLLFADPPYPDFDAAKLEQTFRNMSINRDCLVSFKAPKDFAFGRAYGEAILQLGLLDENGNLSWKF